MPEPYIGEMRIFAGSTPPLGWAFCEGQLLPVNGNELLHTLLGTTFGGNGTDTFGLPDMRGRVPVGAGQADGLIVLTLGQPYGEETVTLSPQQIAAHSHPFKASSVAANTTDPMNASFGTAPANVLVYPDSNKPTVAPRTFSPDMVGVNDGPVQPHENMMPTTAIHYIIALSGISPL